MSRAIVIGGTGHVGTYLVPRLVEAGHEVVVLSRSQREPYQPHEAWQKVERVVVDRKEADASGQFGQMVADLQPDIVIDMICFTLDSARQLTEALRGKVQHFMHTGTVWVHGPCVQAPYTEEESRAPFGEYGVQKAQVEAYLLDEARRNHFPATIVHPGHIVGPGWTPLNPAGNFNPQVYETLAKGEKLLLPHFGLETVHHVHADDVARLFIQCMLNWSTSVGEAFHSVSPAAVSLRGYAQEVASWFGQEADLDFLPWEEWRKTVSETDAEQTYQHIMHSPSASMEKARRLLNYCPRYSSFQAVRESVMWMAEHGVIEV